MNYVNSRKLSRDNAMLSIADCKTHPADIRSRGKDRLIQILCVDYPIVSHRGQEMVKIVAHKIMGGHICRLTMQALLGGFLNCPYASIIHDLIMIGVVWVCPVLRGPTL